VHPVHSFEWSGHPFISESYPSFVEQCSFSLLSMGSATPTNQECVNTSLVCSLFGYSWWKRHNPVHYGWCSNKGSLKETKLKGNRMMIKCDCC